MYFIELVFYFFKISVNEFYVKRQFIAQIEYAVSPDTALADNTGVGAHPGLLTIQSVRMGVEFDVFPQILLIPRMSKNLCL